MICTNMSLPLLCPTYMYLQEVGCGIPLIGTLEYTMSELQNIFSLTIKSFKHSNLVTIIVCTKLSFPYQILYVAKFFWMNIFVLLAHLFALYRVSYRGRDARGYPLPGQSSPLHFLKSPQLDQKAYLKK